MNSDSAFEEADEEAQEEAKDEYKHDANQRFLEALSHFTEWARQIITLSAGVLVLSATFLKDIVVDSEPPSRFLAGVLLAVAYMALLLAIWRALRFISYASGTVLAEGPVIAGGKELDCLQRLLRQTQRLFFSGLVAFAALAVVSLVSWVLQPEVRGPLVSPR